MAAPDKSNDHKLLIHFNLLISQNNPKGFLKKIIRWLLFAGKYIFIIVQVVLLIALLYRFKLDGDLKDLKNEIERKRVFIEELRPIEIQIKQIQFKLSTIGTFYGDYIDYTKIFRAVADKTPPGVKFTNISLGKNADKIEIKINAQTQSSSDISNFLAALKTNPNFQGVILSTLTLQQKIITFTIELSTPQKEQT